MTFAEDVARMKMAMEDQPQRDQFFESPLIPYLNQRPNIFEQAVDYWYPQLVKGIGPGITEILAGNVPTPTAEQIWEDPFLNALMPHNLGIPASFIGPKSKTWKTMPQVGGLAGTKVVDEAGNPLRVFHGTNKVFGDYDPLRSTSESEAIFHSDNPWIASQYTGSNKGRQFHVPGAGFVTEGANVRADYLNMQNPYIKDMGGEFKEKSFWSIIENAKAKGHDGVIFENVKDAPRGYGDLGIPPSNVYVSFEPSQIHNALAGPPETYPQGAFSSRYDKNVLVEIPDVGVKVKIPGETDLFLEKGLRNNILTEKEIQIYKDNIDRNYSKQTKGFRQVIRKLQKAPHLTISDLVNAPDIYNNYPSIIADMKVNYPWMNMSVSNDTLNIPKASNYPSFYHENLYKEALIHELQHSIQNIEGFPVGTSTFTPGYHNFLGEIQARDAAARMGLTAEQLTINPPLHPLAGTGGLAPDARWGPLSTENIPIEDAIVRMRNEGVSSSQVGWQFPVDKSGRQYDKLTGEYPLPGGSWDDVLRSDPIPGTDRHWREVREPGSSFAGQINSIQEYKTIIKQHISEEENRKRPQIWFESKDPRIMVIVTRKGQTAFPHEYDLSGMSEADYLKVREWSDSGKFDRNPIGGVVPLAGKFPDRFPKW